MVATSGLVVSDLVFEPSDLLVDTGDSYTQAPYLLLRSKKSFRCLQSVVTGANYSAVAAAAAGDGGGGEEPGPPYVSELYLVKDLDPIPQDNSVMLGVTARKWTDKVETADPIYIAHHDIPHYSNGFNFACIPHSGWANHGLFSAAFVFNDESECTCTKYGAKTTYRQ